MASKTKMKTKKTTPAKPVANTGSVGASGLVAALTQPNVATPATVDPGEYVSTAAAPEMYTPSTYTSRYASQIDSALNDILNWNYDPLQDAAYQSLAKIYGARGNIAAKNSLADAAALNGGYGSSYAVSAAQQARNQYNQELAALVPELENTAYNRASGKLSALRDADDSDYNKWRDSENDRLTQYNLAYQAYRDLEGDNQWKYQTDYNRYRDTVGDQQWQKTFDYNAGRDKVADSQWLKTFKYNAKRDKVADKQWNMEYLLSKKGSSGGSRGGSRSSGGSSGGYSGGGYTGGGYGDDDAYKKAQEEAKRRELEERKRIAASKLKEGTATGTFVNKRNTK